MSLLTGLLIGALIGAALVVVYVSYGLWKEWTKR